MTRVAAAAAIIGAAYAGASWWLGQRVEARYQARLDRVVALLGADKIAERRYERGLFSAQSTVVLQFSLPTVPGADAGPATGAARPAQPLRITLQDDIRHGPWPGLRPAAARIHTRLVKVDGVDDALRQAFAKASAPEFDTLVGFGGDYSGRMRLPAGEMVDPRQAGTRAEWQEMACDYTLAADGSRTTGVLHWPQVSTEALEPADDPKASAAQAAGAVKMRLDGLRVEFDLSPVEGQWLLATGQGHGSFGTLEVTQRAPGQGAFEPLMLVRDMQMSSQTTRHEGLLDTAYRATGQGRLGNLDLKELRYESQLRRIDAQALGTAQKLLMQWLSAPQPGATGVPPEDVEAMARRLIDARPEYRDSFSATTTDGQTARFGYGLSLGEAPAAGAQAPAGVPWQMLALRRLRVDAALHLPKAWLPVLARLSNDPALDAGEVAEMAQRFVQQGWLREEGQAYTAQAEYGGGRLLLNGQPLLGGRR